MEFRVLGPLEVVADGRLLGLGSRKQRALLALLLLRAGEVVPRDRLIEELWHGKPPAAAEASVHSYLSRLRSVLGADRLLTRSPGYALVLTPEELDLRRFERFVAEGRAALSQERPTEAAQRLGEGLALWRGDPFADFLYEPFAQAEIARLTELRLEALEGRLEAGLQMGRHESLVGELGPLVAAYPLRERLCRQLMMALYRSGRQADALAAFADVRRVLVEELGLEPGPELRALQRAILRQDEALAPREITASAAISEVRKTVTVLALAATDSRTDPEARRALAERIVERAADVLAEHGGLMKRQLGDQVLAVFGVPKLHEDDALRAARAGCDLVTALAQIAKVRIGIASGEVLAVGSQVTGEPLRSAPLLAAEAAAGEIVLDDATRTLAGVAVCVERGSGGWRLLGVRPSTRPVPLRLDTPFVGRRAQLEQLRAAFARCAESGSSVLVTVLGEAGVGKSRLAQQLAHELSEQAIVLTGRCVSYGKGMTLWPLRELVQQLAGGVDSARLRQLLAGEPDADVVARRIETAIGPAGGVGAIEELFFAVRRLLESAARRSPLLVVLEDLHWAEPTLLDLVEHAAVARAPLCLLCLARPELGERRAGWGGRAEAVELEPLREDEAEHLLQALTGGLVRSTRDQVLDAAQGNPLFLEQLAAALVEATPRDEDLPLPSTIQALLAVRLERLGPGEQALLERGAIIGKSFPLEAATELLPEQARPTVSRHRDALIGSGYLQLSSLQSLHGDDCAFRHALIQEACYRSIPKAVRAQLHEGFARWREQKVASQGGEYAEIIGYHLEQAYRLRVELGLLDEPAQELGRQAAAWLSSAGRRAEQRGDPRAAAKLLERAAALVHEDDPHRPELLIDLGHVLIVAGEPARAEAILDTAIESAKRAKSPRLEAHARLLSLRAQFVINPVTAETARIQIERLLAIFERCGDERGLYRCCDLLGWLSWNACQYGEAGQAWERAIRHARMSRDEVAIASCCAALAGVARYAPTPCSEGLRRCEQLLAYVHDNRLAAARVWRTRAVLLAMQGRFDDARAEVDRVIAVIDELGSPAGMGAPDRQGEAQIELLADNPAIAEAHARAGFALAGDTSHGHSTAGVLAEALLRQGKLGEAEQFTRMSERLGADNDIHNAVLWRRVRAEILAARGKPGEAERLARESVTFTDAIDAVNVRADALMSLAEVLRIADRPAEATPFAEEALSLYERKENLVSAAKAQTLLQVLRRARR